MVELWSETLNSADYVPIKRLICVRGAELKIVSRICPNI